MDISLTAWKEIKIFVKFIPLWYGISHKSWHTCWRQPQQLLLILSIKVTCFGQAFKYTILKLYFKFVRSEIHLHFSVSFKIMYSNARGWSVRPKYVAYNDKIKEVYFGWWWQELKMA